MKHSPPSARRAKRGSAFYDEIKNFDVSLFQSVSIAADWTGSEVPCTNYIQSDGTTVGAYTDSALIPSAVGAGYGQIDGSKYKLKKIQVRGDIKWGPAADQADAATPPVVRLVLVLDKMPQGAQAQGEDVFTDMGTIGQNNHSFLAMGAGRGGRFVLLKDITIGLKGPYGITDGASTGSLASEGYVFNFTKILGKEVHIKASGSTPATAQLSDCNIFLLAHASGTVSPSVTAVSRVWYMD